MIRKTITTSRGHLEAVSISHEPFKFLHGEVDCVVEQRPPGLVDDEQKTNAGASWIIGEWFDASHNAFERSRCGRGRLSERFVPTLCVY